jgi:multidrug resistance efflux pump
MARLSMSSVNSFFTKIWKRFLGLSRWVQILIGVLILVVLGGIVVLARGEGGATAANTVPTVTVQSINSFGDTSNGVDVLGTVQSVSEADLLAQSGGTVTAVHTTLGATVPAGFVIANLDSAAASASVLQAQGGYDAAVAAQKAVNLQSQNSTGSLLEAQTNVRTGYQSTYTSLQNTISNNVDVFFGDNTPVGPQLLINPLTTADSLPRARRDISALMANYQASVGASASADPLTLLSNEQAYLSGVSVFLTNLANLAHTQGSAATPAQLASLATAQSTLNSLIAGVSSSRTAYNAAVTAAAVGQTQSSGGQGVTSSEANVESALGGLRAAQAVYEKTVVRAPIGGTVNYLNIHVGDSVSANQHVATVARNNALEVVMQLSENDAHRLAVGDTVTIAGSYKGVVTTIAPALNPTTKQIEADVAVSDGATLTNGQSVQVTLPTLPTDVKTSSATKATVATSTAMSIQLPLTAVKLLPSERDVFTVDSTGHLVAHAVEIGDVIGDRIVITTNLDPTLMIVTDARGLAAGDLVLVSTRMPSSGQ